MKETLQRAAELLRRYASVVRDCHSHELERFDYLPEIEESAENVEKAASAVERLEREVTQQTNFKYMANQRADAAEAKLKARPEAQAQNADVLAQVEAALRKNPLIAMFLDQSFWHANFVDIAIRYNGELRRYEADWIKDIWYIVRRRGLSATEAVRAEQSEPPMNSGLDK